MTPCGPEPLPDWLWWWWMVGGPAYALAFGGIILLANWLLNRFGL